jgi:hypothetical protein
MSDVHRHSLSPDSPCVDVPADTLKVTLRAHQQAALHAIEEKEKMLLAGMDNSGETLFSNYGILGDSVGVGKSLMVLGHIARLRSIPPLKGAMTVRSDPHSSVFSLRYTQFTDLSEAGSLIVVPHTLFRQWAGYIKNQTNLRAVLLDKRKALTMDTFEASVLGADITLVSNTMYKDFSLWVRDRGIRWKRAFFDEADTIHIVNGYPKPVARFTWLITASWINLLFFGETYYLNLPQLDRLIYSPTAPYPELKPYFQETFTANRPYNYMRYYITSNGFFGSYASTTHKLRGRLVVRSSEAFIQQSISLPPVTRTNILCKAPLQQRIVADVVPAEIQQLLHGGDTAGALAALGVKTEDTKTLVDAVTETLQKELKRLRATYEFKASIEYATAQSKEAALKSLEEKIKRTEESIENLQKRIENFKEEVCPICYDEPQQATLTPCCSRIFCAGCILTSMSRNPACPMCRETLQAKRLTNVVTAEEKNSIVTAGSSEAAQDNTPGPKEKKTDALLRLFRENPQGRFLVFSRYDNPFVAMEGQIEALGVRVKQLKGNKDAIAATLRAFESRDLRCLLLNAHYAGAGLNITAATHVILLHAMTHEEEKQILGRAYRMGRTEPLNFIRLLHSDEMTITN